MLTAWLWVTYAFEMFFGYVYICVFVSAVLLYFFGRCLELSGVAHHPHPLSANIIGGFLILGSVGIAIWATDWDDADLKGWPGWHWFGRQEQATEDFPAIVSYIGHFIKSLGVCLHLHARSCRYPFV